jgi:hypothetical protein
MAVKSIISPFQLRHSGEGRDLAVASLREVEISAFAGMTIG